MRKWAIKDMREFLSRQGGFDFAVVTDAVLTLAVQVKRDLSSMFRNWLTGFRSVPIVKKPEQLRLDFLQWMRIGVTA